MGFSHSSLSKLNLSPNDEQQLIDNIHYFYLKLNLTELEVSEKLNIPIAVVKYVINKFKFIKDSIARKQSIKEAYIRKHGVSHHMQLSSVKNKIKQTCLERYGVENPFQDTERMKQAFQEKLGVDNPWQAEIVKEKSKQTKLERYGNNVYVNIEKRKRTNLDKYGVEHGLENSEVRNKIKQTNLKKYGVENVYAADEIKNKIKNTNLERYGVESPMQCKEICNKIIKKFKSGNTLQKIHETKKKNGTYGKSKLEDEIYEILCKEFGKENVERQIYLHKHYYDFRINNMLLLEIHGTYWHNKRPFVECEEHIREYKDLVAQGNQKKAIANKWRYHDVEKLNYCKENNIPYLAFYINDSNELKISMIKEMLSNGY